MRFLLVVAGEVVDSADSPHDLHFYKTADHTSYEVHADIDGTVYPLAAVDLTGYEHLRNDVAYELRKDIEFRAAFPSFADELKIVDGPLIAFGEPHIGPDGFIGHSDCNDCNDCNGRNDCNKGDDCNSREKSPRG
jgi:hypothetical protein